MAPDKLQVSIDATNVSILKGAWTEMKLATFGNLEPGHDRAGQPVKRSLVAYDH